MPSRRFTFLFLVFVIFIFSFFHLVLPQQSYFYQTTSVPSVTPPEYTKQARMIVIPQYLPTTTPSETPTIVSPTPDPIVYYTVQSGDTLSGIANNFGVTWIDLANLNQISNPNMLEAGQIIKISANASDYKNIDPYYVDEVYQAKEGEKHILVVLSEQRLYTYEGDQLIGSYLISSGTASHPTEIGVFKVWIKLPTTTMSGGIGSDTYNLPNVKFTMYFYGDYGIHGTYWHNNFGTPMSHGCVNMTETDAEIVYNWASVGTVVQVIP